MRKIIFAINITLDGFIDHTAVIADDELHDNAAKLFKNADLVLYGRVAYQLMADYWPIAYSDKSLTPGMKNFADAINNIDKIVYSKTLTNVSWRARIVRSVNPAEIKALKHLPGKDILLGAGARIAQTFMELDLIDEYHLLVQPVILGNGIRLFAHQNKPKNLVFIGQNLLQSGVIELIYSSKKDNSF